MPWPIHYTVVDSTEALRKRSAGKKQATGRWFITTVAKNNIKMVNGILYTVSHKRTDGR